MELQDQLLYEDEFALKYLFYFCVLQVVLLKLKKMADQTYVTDVKEEFFLSYLLHNSCILIRKFRFNLHNFCMCTLSCCYERPASTSGKIFKFHIWRHITYELIQKLNVWTHRLLGKKEIRNWKYIKLLKARKKKV